MGWGWEDALGDVVARAVGLSSGDAGEGLVRSLGLGSLVRDDWVLSVLGVLAALEILEVLVKERVF